MLNVPNKWNSGKFETKMNINSHIVVFRTFPSMRNETKEIYQLPQSYQNRKETPGRILWHEPTLLSIE